MRTLAALGILLCMSIASASAVDVDCWFGNCLEEGWRLDAWSGDYKGEVHCRHRDCSREGWVYEDTMGRKTEVQCYAGGCFRHGSVEIDSRTNQILMETICRGGDCFEWGWRIQSPNRPNLEVRCIRTDCNRYGWEIFAPTGRVLQQVKCKWNSCFGEGWTIYN